MRLLLVEDNESCAALFRRVWSMENDPSDLLYAADGIAAGQLLIDPACPLPDVVVTDLQMPRMGGLQLTQWLRRDPRFRTIPVIILTASSEECDEQWAHYLNVADYLSKPDSIDGFRSTIHRIRDAVTRIQAVT